MTEARSKRRVLPLFFIVKSFAKLCLKLHNLPKPTFNVIVDLNFNFECDWLVELSDNKLSNNQWKIGVFRPIEEIVIFMISNDIVQRI